MSENLLVLSPYIDIHTHRICADDDVIAVCSLRLGKECADYVPHPFWAGVHPWDCDTVERDAVLQLHRMDIDGVGEIGLDRTRGDIALQRLFFRRAACSGGGTRLARCLACGTYFGGDHSGSTQKAGWIEVGLWFTVSSAARSWRNAISARVISFR